VGRNKEQFEYTDTQMTNVGLGIWYDTFMKRFKNPTKYPSKYTPEERDRIMKENKIGPYRTWEFDINRWNQIIDEVEDYNSTRMITAGVTYYRNVYSDEAQFLSDEEIINRGLYKQLYQDRANEAHEFRRENKELEKNAYSEEFVK
jgi:hypothetical protein